MLLSLYGGFWDNWQLYHKVTFDGVNKLIIVNPGEDMISVKKDIYSDWKEWIQLEDYMKFLPAIRATGGDTIGAGDFTGDVYFLINGWRLQIDHSCVIDGVLYSDDYPSPFIQVAGTQIVTNKVSALVQTIAPVVTVDVPTVQEIRTEMDTNSVKLTAIDSKVQTLSNGPTAAAIADQVRTELTPELIHLMTLQNNTGLTPTQATMLLEMYDLLGLDPTKPLTVTNTARTAGTINQTISTSPTSTVVTRI